MSVTGRTTGASAPPQPDSDVCRSAQLECGTATLADWCGGAAKPRNCGSCTTGFDCDANNRCIACVPKTPLQMCTDAAKTCGMYIAHDGCSSTVSVDCSAATGITCVSPETCSGNVCVPRSTTTPSNDTCTNPAPITLVNGFWDADVDTKYATSQGSGSCAGSGNDVVFVLTLGPNTTDLLVTVTPLESTVQAVVYLRSTCGGTEVTSSCKSASAANQPLSYIIANIAPGTYYLWIDGYGSTNGLQHVTVSEVPPPTNDTCAQNGDAPIALIADAPGSGGSLTSAVADYGTTLEGSCTGAAAGRELVYSFTPYNTGYYKIIMTPSSSFDAVLWVSTVCGDTSSCVIRRDDSSTAPETVVIHGAVGTTFFIYADSYSANAFGPFTIQVVTEPPPP